MKSRCTAHLWLEWREHRAAILGLLAVSALGSILMAWLGVNAEFPMLDAPAFALASAAALVIFSLGSEIVGRELSGDARAAIARLPGSLATPFALRVSFFVAVVAACALLAWWSMREGVNYFAGRSIADAPLVRYPLVFLLIGVAGVWTLAASCWLKKSALAAPAAAAVLGISIVAPLSFRVHARPIYSWLAGDLAFCVTLLAIAGLVAAWISFARGLRRSGGRGAAARSGVLTLLVLTSPVPALAGYRTCDWLHLEPSDTRFRIESALVGEGGRYAFLDCGVDVQERATVTSYAFVVDLESGAYESKGPDSWFGELSALATPGARLPASSRTQVQPFVKLSSLDSPRGGFILDGRSATLIGDEDALRANPETNARLAAIIDETPVVSFEPARIPHWRAEDHLVAIENEHALLVLESAQVKRAADRRSDHGLLRVDRATGARTPLVDAAGQPIVARTVYGSHVTSCTPDFTPGGHTVLRRYRDGERYDLLRIDPQSNVVATSPAIDWVSSIVILDDDTVLATLDDGRALAKLRFDGSVPEIVFPRRVE